MKTPRARFQEVGSQAEAWRKLTSEILFEEATDAAMLQFVSRTNDEDAASQIRGALTFLKILASLGDITVDEKPPVTRQINYDAQK